MTGLFPACGPSCFRKKQIDALKYAEDSEKKDIALYGHGYVMDKKQKAATSEADAQVEEYRRRFKDIPEAENSEYVENLKYNIERNATLARILNRLNTFFTTNASSSNSSWTWVFGAFLDFIITILGLLVIYLAYTYFFPSRMVGGKRLGK